MDQAGFEVGFKVLEYLYPKVKAGKRPTKLLEVLQLEKGTDNDNEYILTDYKPLCSKFISVPAVSTPVLTHCVGAGRV